MMINKKVIDGVTVIEPKGELDLYNSFDLVDLFNVLLDHRTHSVVTNLAGVPHIDSAGIGALLYSHSRFKKAGGAMKLATIKDGVKNIFHRCHLDSTFDVYETEHEAISSFRMC